MITKNKEELVRRLLEYHAVPYRLRQSAAEELADEIRFALFFQYVKGKDTAYREMEEL